MKFKKVPQNPKQYIFYFCWMDWKKYIHSDSEIMFGKPVIIGTRVPVDLVLEKLSHGISVPKLLEAYPHINEADIYACMAFAAESIRSVDPFPVVS